MENKLAVKNIMRTKHVAIIVVMLVISLLLAIHVFQVPEESDLEILIKDGTLTRSTIDDTIENPSNEHEVFLELVNINKKEIRYQLKNMSLNTIVPEKAVILEVMYQGDWYYNPYHDNVSFTLLLQEIEPNDTLLMQISVLDHKYHGKGHYRFMKSYSIPEISSEDYYAVLYFTLD